MNPEIKMLQKIRKVLISDSTIKGYVADRVYTAHVSSVDRPVYPAISLHLIPGQASISAPDMVEMMIQVDLWFPTKDFDVDQVLTCYQKVRDLLHRQDLTDKSMNLIVGRITEITPGPMMYDEDAKCHHRPGRFSVVAI